MARRALDWVSQHDDEAEPRARAVLPHRQVDAQRRPPRVQIRRRVDQRAAARQVGPDAPPTAAAATATAATTAAAAATTTTAAAATTTAASNSSSRFATSGVQSRVYFPSLCFLLAHRGR